MQFDQKTLINVKCFVEIHWFQLNSDRLLPGCWPALSEAAGNAGSLVWGQRPRQTPGSQAASGSLQVLVSKVWARGFAVTRLENLENPGWSRRLQVSQLPSPATW